MQSETLVEEFSRLVREYKQDDGPGGIEAWNLIADFAVDNAEAIEAALSAAEPQPAPFVAVKAIEAVWEYSLVIDSSVRRGDGPDQYKGVTEALRLVKEARTALSAQVQDVAVPEGWQLVPVEPTPAMIKAGLDCTVALVDAIPEDLDSREADNFCMSAEYRSMLAAAPAKQEGGANE